MARLEARIGSDAGLKAALEDLRETRTLLRRLPQRRAPRNFRLAPGMAGIRPPAPRAYPVFRFATAIATLLFLASVAVNALAPVASGHLAAAPVPAFGMGGAGGGAPESSAPAAPAATEAPLQAPFAALAATPTAEGTAAADMATSQANLTIQTQDAARSLASGPSTEAGKAAPIQPPTAPQPAGQPVPATWVAMLGLLMIVFAVIAWLLRANSDRRVRRRWEQK